MGTDWNDLQQAMYEPKILVAMVIFANKVAPGFAINEQKGHYMENKKYGVEILDIDGDPFLSVLPDGRYEPRLFESKNDAEKLLCEIKERHPDWVAKVVQVENKQC